MKHQPGFIALVDRARQSVREETIEDVNRRRERGDSFVLLDVREDREWKKSRIVGAEHMGRGVLERDIESRFPNKSESIVLYCGGGYRSALAAASLKEMGYTEVSSMDGGFRSWTEAGLPVDEGE